VVAWTVQAVEDSEIARTMLEEAMGVHGIPEAIHADRGTSMTSKPVAQLLLDLGVDRSHSRPRVSNDNPFSEAAFKTLKYAPVFPEAFGLLADARAFCERFFGYYNHEHRHSGIGLHTPCLGAPRHRGRDPGPPPADARRRARRPPRTVRQPPTPGTETAQGRLDQPALTGGPHTDRVTKPVSTGLTRSETTRMDARDVSPSATRVASARREWSSMTWWIATAVPSARDQAKASLCQQQFGAG
jgi:hypothetical protein